MAQIKSPLLQHPTISHGFFTRKGGCSTGIYGTLNCGPGSQDKPENVKKNRQLILSSLAPNIQRLCGLYQIHSNIVYDLINPHDITDQPKADAIVTTQKNIALGILTADCAPVLFADAENNVIAAAHAGWQGALSGIIENTVNIMCNKGANRSRIYATIGPAIAQENYEVGPEFFDKFIYNDKAYYVFFMPSPKEGHFLFDLKAFVLHQLKKAGVKSALALPHDTYSNAEEFFSYRRTTHRKEQDYGRQISAIVIL